MVELSPGASVALGVIVGLLSTSVQSVGLTLQRKSHLLEEEKEDDYDRRPPYKRRRWQLGMLMFIVANVVGSTIQITTLPLPVLSTLQASGLVFNSICASIILHEPFTRYSFVGTMLVAAGALLIALFGAIAEPSHNLDQLLALLGRHTFVVWMVMTGVVVVLLLFANWLLNRIYPRTTPRLRLVRGMFYGCVSGILSAHSLLIAKSAVELLVRTIVDRHNQFDRWQSWMILIGLVVFALTQLYYMHCGLKLVSTSVLYPLVFCVYNIIAIVDGLIYFHQSDRLSGLHAGLIALGTVVLLAGVVCLSWRLEENEDEPMSPVSTKHPGHVPMPQSALEPGLGGLGLLHAHPLEEPDAPLDIEQATPGIHGGAVEQAKRRSIDERTPLLARAPTGPAYTVASRSRNSPALDTNSRSPRASPRPPRRRRMTISEESNEIWDELNDRESLRSPVIHRSGELDRRSRAGTLPRQRANTQSAWLDQMRRRSWFDGISAGSQRSPSASQRKRRPGSSSALLDHPDPDDDEASDSDLVAHRSGTWGFGGGTRKSNRDGPGDWLKLRWWRKRLQGETDDLQEASGRGTASIFSDPVDESSIRLLCFSQSEDGKFVGKLQKFPLVGAPHYYTASYVWGERQFADTPIGVENGEIPVLSSLAPFLHMISTHGDFKSTDWWWIDSLCINLEDAQEREKQVRIMADIYRRAKRAIIWLGEEKEHGSDCTKAIEFLHYLSTLQIAFNGDDVAMRNSLEDPEFTEKCGAVSNLLSRPWWTRVWTLQEFVLPKEAKLYCGMASISRGKFKSAIYSIFLCSTISNDFEHELVPRTLFDGAFNRRRIHQWHTKPASTGINLIAIMALLGNHLATDSRDRIYSVLGLITERDFALIGPAEYSTSVEHQFAKLVRSFWTVHGSMDIVCFVHMFSREAAARDLGADIATPTWAPDWRTTIDFASPVPLMASQSASEHIGNFRPLHSMRWKAIYDAPGPQLRRKADVQFSDDLKDLFCSGVLLGTIHGLGHGLLQCSDAQRSAPRAVMQPMDWLEAIARSLVIDRQDKYLCFQAPTHYITDFLFLCHACIDGYPVDWSFETWFDHNRLLKFGDRTLEDLVNQAPSGATSPPPTLHRPSSHPMHQVNDKLDTFLSRFHDSVRKKARRLMVTNEGYTGMAPCRARPGDIVAILYGCSIPLVLRKDAQQDTWRVIGEGYVHNYMNGEVLALVKRGKSKTQRFRLV
ncbi:hypothetical protein E8E13_001135 [Curvularia kusanoi]|uniref:Heterokaryon incompatibility domain-containing protein n=1 Tax=Curvularia kusanoi TaxID=90978 RepID=A0A9P4T575_CURKU|nr:hypothetical protein E8E13_001135 [Curvularia kusanoi]